IPEHFDCCLCSGLILKATGPAIPERFPSPPLDEFVQGVFPFVLAGRLERPNPWCNHQCAEDNEPNSLVSHLRTSQRPWPAWPSRSTRRRTSNRRLRLLSREVAVERISVKTERGNSRRVPRIWR